MEALSVGGLASGLDTNAIIDGLSDLEQVRVNREVNKQTEIETQQTAYNELVSRIGNFAQKAQGMDAMSNYNLYSATSNLDDYATVTGGENATPGTFELEVHSLASSQKVASKAFDSATADLGFSGKFEISNTESSIENDPTKTTTEIEILASDSLRDVMNKINASDAIGVSASILSLGDSNQRLVFTSKEAGANNFLMNELNNSPLGAAGLGFMTDSQRAQTDFDFRLDEGGAADASSTFGELSTGIGANNVTTGDIIRINGTMADGSAATQTDLVIDPSTTSLQDLLDQVETAFGSNVTASMNDSGEIVITDTSGGATEMTLDLEFIDSDTSGSSLSLGESKVINTFSNLMQEGSRAFFSLDGISSSANSNQATEIVDGTTFNLKKVTEPGETVKLSLSRDFDGITEKVQGFVDEYNALLKFIDEKTSVNVEDDDDSNSLPTDDRDNDSSESNGALAGDLSVRRLRNEIQQLMTSTVSELEGVTQYTSLSRVGITTNGNTGLLEVDKEDFKDALRTDFDGVRRLFSASGYSDNPNHELGRFTKDTTPGSYFVDADGDLIADSTTSRIGKVLASNDGKSTGLSIEAESGTGTGTFVFSRGIASLVDTFYQKSNDFVDGIFKKTNEAYDSRIKRMDQRITDLQDRVDTFRAGLIKQFASLEQSIQRLNSQSASFQSQIGSIR